MWPSGRVGNATSPQRLFGDHAMWWCWIPLRFKERGGRRLELDVEPLGPMPLSVGFGYGPEDDGWNHGRWMGEKWIQRVDHDLDAEATAKRIARSMIDHAARATFPGQTGYGIFEHVCIGRPDPSGFPELMTMA